MLYCHEFRDLHGSPSFWHFQVVRVNSRTEEPHSVCKVFMVFMIFVWNKLPIDFCVSYVSYVQLRLKFRNRPKWVECGSQQHPMPRENWSWPYGLSGVLKSVKMIPNIKIASPLTFRLCFTLKIQYSDNTKCVIRVKCTMTHDIHTEHSALDVVHRKQGTEHGTQDARHWTQDTKQHATDAGHRTHNTEHRTWHTKTHGTHRAAHTTHRTAHKLLKQLCVSVCVRGVRRLMLHVLLWHWPLRCTPPTSLS